MVSEMPLSHALPLHGSFLQPLNSFLVVLFHTFTLGVADPEIDLTSNVALFGGFAIPLQGLRIVLFHPVAKAIAESEADLSFCNRPGSGSI